MRLALALTACLSVALPSTAAAQVANCFDCVLGLWDDATLTTNFGVSTPGVPKSLYLGIDLASTETGITGIEFSVAGMRSDTDGILILAVDPIPPTCCAFGTLPAPADTSSTSTGTGGMNIAWSSCLPNDRPLVRITILHLGALTNKVFVVKRRYPTTNIDYRAPVFTRCNSPTFTAVRVSGGCYILNWDGDPAVPCDTGIIGVDDATWSGVKQMFR